MVYIARLCVNERKRGESRSNGWNLRGLPARFAPGAPAAATAAAETTAATAAAAAPLLRPGFVHGEPAPLELVLVERRAGRLAFSGVGHLDKSESA